MTADPLARRSREYRADRPIVSELAAGGLVLLQGTRRLLLLHEAQEDRWCLPKGHVDPGESLAQTALREVREEAGLSDLVLGEEVAEVSYRFFDPRRDLNVFKVVVYFAMQSPTESLRLEPIFDRAAWTEWGTARERLPYATDHAALDQAERRGPRAAR